MIHGQHFLHTSLSPCLISLSTNVAEEQYKFSLTLFLRLTMSILNILVKSNPTANDLPAGNDL